MPTDSADGVAIPTSPTAPATTASQTFSAPARVNLIGEHTDYTGGYVLPMAISFQTTTQIACSEDGLYHFRSKNFPAARSLTPTDRSPRDGKWSDYPIGVLRQLQALGIEPPPFTLSITGNVPLGSGLSSSASVEVATAVALLAFSGAKLPTEEIAVLCRRAENEYVNSPCGIMDQFVITAARAGHTLLLNTRDLAYELLPMNWGALAECSVVIANSMVRHSIAGGDYGLRRRELEAGQTILRQAFPALRDLGDAILDQLASCEAEMSPESYRRCRHVISENARVLEAKAAMLAGDPVALGDAMTRAHASERDDFECSVAEVDFLVETAVAHPACYGARLTGGGFGGCTVNLVKTSEAQTFREHLQSTYRERFNLIPETYISQAVDGAVARLQNATEAQA